MLAQNLICRKKIKIRFKIKNIEFVGLKVLNEKGSKEEKISGIMQDLNIFHLKLWRFLV